MTAILGVSAFYHDSAAALIVDGQIVAAVQEERFSREKYDARFPAQAIDYCLSHAGLTPADLDYIAFYDKPLAKFDRLLETYLGYAPVGLDSFSLAVPVWLKKKLFTRRAIRQGCPDASRASLVFLEHHESHAASAFFASPFEEAAILTLDGVGEWATAASGVGTGNTLRLTREMRFPHSLGLLYSAFTYYCGFKVNSGEYKLMGLAPYGRPLYRDLISRYLIDVKPDGSFWLDMAYFNYCQGLTMTNQRFHDLFGGPPRQPDSRLEQRHMDLAASVQAVTEDVLMRLGTELHAQTGMKNLVMAGGVALNCVANGKLLREGPFDHIWIQPAAGDAGGALGSALFVWHQLLNKPRPFNGRSPQGPSLLGPSYSTNDIETFLKSVRASYTRYETEAALIDDVTDALIDERIVGWFHGRMEFGPRALGARSILGDPRSPKMQATMNLKIKFRESFRPFAPSVLREQVHDWFEMRPGEDSPYMLLIAPVLDRHRVAIADGGTDSLTDDPDLRHRVSAIRSSVPAITHVDFSARVQTIDEQHGRYHRLLRAFHQKTGCPILVNTSFNLSWEPIVMSPQEAYHTFMQSEMDVLVLEDCVLRKHDQPLGVTIWADSRSAQPSLSSPWLDPTTGDPLIVTSRCARNAVSGTCYPVEDGIPRLFVGDDRLGELTRIVNECNGKAPSADYEGMDNQRALLEKMRAGRFVRLLNDQIPYQAAVLEVGCGTGKLTNFLSIAHRSVLGIDVSFDSLRLAQQFKVANGIDRAAFAHMNLLKPALKNDFFDVVICNDVLHYTGNCREAFRRVGRMVRPGGFIVIGLRSAFAQPLDRARRAVFRSHGRTRREPESAYTIDELLGWMGEDGFAFINSIPKPTGGLGLSPTERLFARHDSGSAVSRFLNQLASLGSGYHDGNFLVIASRVVGDLHGRS